MSEFIASIGGSNAQHRQVVMITLHYSDGTVQQVSTPNYYPMIPIPIEVVPKTGTWPQSPLPDGRVFMD